MVAFLFLRETSRQVIQRGVVFPESTSVLLRAARKPFLLVLEPSVLPAILVGSFFYSLQVWLYIDVPSTYKRVYGFSTADAGLAFVSLGCGMAVGLGAFGFLSDAAMIRAARGGKKLPKYRIPLLLLAVVIVVCGMVIYVAGAEPEIGWPFPMVGNMLTGLGLFASSVRILLPLFCSITCLLRYF